MLLDRQGGAVRSRQNQDRAFAACDTPEHMQSVVARGEQLGLVQHAQRFVSYVDQPINLGFVICAVRLPL